ncbi:MAG: hypothetical protein AB8B96_16100 [Lysobacterales bacterium]
MRNFVLAIALTGVSLTIAAHDGGVSELTACTAKNTTTFTWQLHEVEGAVEHWLTVSDSAGPVTPVSFQRSGHHHVELRWKVEAVGGNPDWVIRLPGVKQLPYGHRVLASNCDQSRRAVLSQWQDQWKMAALSIPAQSPNHDVEPALSR